MAALARALTFVTAVGAFACGSRSALLEPSAVTASGGSAGTAASGGTGGAAASGGTGGVAASGGTSGETGGGGFGGGVGGTGGVPAPPCTALAHILPTFDVDNPLSQFDANPELAASSDDAAVLTYAVARRPVAVPGVFTSLVHTSLSWSIWSTSPVLSPVYFTFGSNDLGTTFRAGRGFDDHFSVFVSYDVPGGSFTSFAPQMNASSNDTGPTLDLGPGPPSFVTRGANGRHLVATSQGGTVTLASVALAPSGFDQKSSALGCAGSGIVSDAVAWQDGWLVALSNAGNAPNLGCSGADPGPPTRIDVVFVDANAVPSYVLGFDAGAPVDRLSAAPNATGIWIVYRVASGGAIPPIRWARVEPANAGVVGPGDVTHPGDQASGGFDAAALGDQLAVAWREDTGFGGPTLTLAVLSATGAEQARTAIQPPPSSAVSLAPSPDGMSLAAAWIEQQDQPDSVGTKAHLARFDCVGGS